MVDQKIKCPWSKKVIGDKKRAEIQKAKSWRVRIVAKLILVLSFDKVRGWFSKALVDLENRTMKIKIEVLSGEKIKRASEKKEPLV